MALCGKQSRDYALCLKNTVYFHVASVYTMNFCGWFLMCICICKCWSFKF